MDDEKERFVKTASSKPEEPGIAQGVSNLIGSAVSKIAETVKDAASSITGPGKHAQAASDRVDPADDPAEEVSDAPPMTADEIAEHAAADTQPAQRPRRKRKTTAKKTVVGKAVTKKATKAKAKKAPGKRKAPPRKAARKTAKTSPKKSGGAARTRRKSRKRLRYSPRT